MPKAKTCSLSCFESIHSFFFSQILRFSDPFLQFSARIKAFVLSHAYLMSHAFQCIFSGQFSLFLNDFHIFLYKA